jgi:plastocyanin
MLEEIWTGILDLTAKFVIPDWGALIVLLPIGIFVLVLIVIIRTMWRLARAAPARRGKHRITPRTPPGVHMPGPTLAPVFAAIGAGLLFLGLVFGGPIIILGVIALILTLLYWLAEATRIYDEDIGDTVPTLPAVVHDGPPPGVHMPGPSFRPFLGALGTALLLLGLVFGEWLLAVGVIALILTLVGWLVDAVGEYRKTVEADTTGHLENLPRPKTPSLLLWVLAILVIGGVAIQAGWLPPTAANSGDGAAPGASGALPPAASGPPASGAPAGSAVPPPDGAPAADVTVTAQNIAFDQATLTVPADKPFKLAFVNNDAGTPHNVEFKDASGALPFKGEIFNGVATKVYDVPALPAGTYTFMCVVHPNMTGTATAQ